MKRSLQRFLRRRGATAEEIENAARHGYLSLLVLDRAIMPGTQQYTIAELAERAGTDLETARLLWRAIGFPDLAEGLPVFTKADVDALRAFVDRIKTSSVLDWTLERALSQARVLSSSLARVADSETDELTHSARLAREAGLDDEQFALAIAERLDFEAIARLIDHAHRLQLRAAIWRRLAGIDPSTPGAVTGAVGFVDLVGYTALSQDLDESELGALVARFADLTHDSVVGQGGRIVKTIGDEVMFVTDTASAAAAIALMLTERSKEDELLPSVRAGVAYGPLLAREGDYFGPVVNFASRLTDLARPGQVLASGEFADALAPATGIQARRHGVRRLRDIGRVEVFRLDRA
ncbi:MAG: adenylate/guanylate cyclase domain-containing protein [Acidimicrobiia bacterium]